MKRNPQYFEDKLRHCDKFVKEKWKDEVKMAGAYWDLQESLKLIQWLTSELRKRTGPLDELYRARGEEELNKLKQDGKDG